mmetsp:Transcript_20712/g.44784  ORF Transcript_20712/g.44784 Transcript_20712/m.44784 type:complete len:271 (+) Transcript_20712:540-1352(+)
MDCIPPQRHVALLVWATSTRTTVPIAPRLLPSVLECTTPLQVGGIVSRMRFRLLLQTEKERHRRMTSSMLLLQLAAPLCRGFHQPTVLRGVLPLVPLPLDILASGSLITPTAFARPTVTLSLHSLVAPPMLIHLVLPARRLLFRRISTTILLQHVARLTSDGFHRQLARPSLLLVYLLLLPMVLTSGMPITQQILSIVFRIVLMFQPMRPLLRAEVYSRALPVLRCTMTPMIAALRSFRGWTKHSVKSIVLLQMMDTLASGTSRTKTKSV